MTQHRPDLLPFARPARMGLPYHGLVKSSLLTLPSAATLAYTQPDSGECWFVQHPKAAVASVTEGDLQWQKYALLSGTGRAIGGHNLGNEYSLYCDANYTWKVRTELTAGNGSFTVAVYLVGLFGLIHGGSATRYAMTERKLAEATYSVVTYSGAPVTWSVGNGATRSYSPTGDKILLNVASNYFPNAYSTFSDTGLGGNLFQHDVVVITLVGDGSITPGSVGSGIGATISHPYSADALEIIAGSQYRWAYAYTPSGGTTYLDYWYSQIIPPIAPGDVYQRKEATVSFGSSTVYALTEYTGYYDEGNVSYGTATVNGAEFPIYAEGWYVCTLGLNLVAKDVNLWGLYLQNSDTTMAGCGHAGHIVTGGEDYGDYWSYNPGSGEYASDPDTPVCWV